MVSRQGTSVFFLENYFWDFLSVDWLIFDWIDSTLTTFYQWLLLCFADPEWSLVSTSCYKADRLISGDLSPAYLPVLHCGSSGGIHQPTGILCSTTAAQIDVTSATRCHRSTEKRENHLYVNYTLHKKPYRKNTMTRTEEILESLEYLYGESSLRRWIISYYCSLLIVAKRLAEEIGIQRISIGDAVRHVLTKLPDAELCRLLKTYLISGCDIPDTLEILCLEALLRTADCQARGWILDGYPSTFSKLNVMMQRLIVPTIVFELVASNKTCMLRSVIEIMLSKKQYVCKKNYNLAFHSTLYS